MRPVMKRPSFFRWDRCFVRRFEAGHNIGFTQALAWGHGGVIAGRWLPDVAVTGTRLLGDAATSLERLGAVVPR